MQHSIILINILSSCRTMQKRLWFTIASIQKKQKINQHWLYYIQGWQSYFIWTLPGFFLPQANHMFSFNKKAYFCIPVTENMKLQSSLKHTIVKFLSRKFIFNILCTRGFQHIYIHTDSYGRLFYFIWNLFLKESICIFNFR